MRIKYTKNILEELVKDSISTADVVRKLGIKETGSNHRHIKQRLNFYGIDTSHFIKNATFSGKKQNRNFKRSGYLELLKENFDSKRTPAKYLRLAMIEFGFDYKCSECELGHLWNGKEITLQIDHINGNGFDNSPKNLRFLCPNCHSQTDNFGSKNKFSAS